MRKTLLTPVASCDSVVRVKQHPLKSFLVDEELTAEQFAERVRKIGGVETTGGYISQILIGHRYPSRFLAIAISEATKGRVSVADLMEFKPGRAA